MNVHEYQAKAVIRSFNAKTPNGVVLEDISGNKLSEVVSQFGLPLVVKGQIHAGGRGKGGGVKVVDSEAKLEEAANAILGMTLVTNQTGPAGKKVRKLLIEEGLNIKRELYLGVVIDRTKSLPCVMVSEEGGVEIEEVAEHSPEKIYKVWVDPIVSLMPSQARELAFFLNLKGAALASGIKIIQSLYKAFEANDASLMEINPLVETSDGDIVALDCKISFDDNSLFRQADIVKFRDIHEEEELELEASKYDLNYIKLDGEIGCMVNGAGLAMATMDIIKIEGGEPANFLDVGGGASAEQIENAFKIILADKAVKAIFINIFGGILRCDRLAHGIVNAAKNITIDIPVIIRMEGTNIKEGAEILKASDFDFIVADSMKDGARKAVASLGRRSDK